MEMEVVAKLFPCKALVCPTIYKSEKGTFVIQGTRVSDKVREDIPMAEDEEAVEIPAELIDILIRNLKE